ncbi:hypothetical protein INR49_031779 [Caranx melampygus]|nr:hypothetical protein INR49_031779 [Caranx melampygus]
MEPLEEYHSPFDFEQGVNTSYLYLSPAYSDTPPSSPAVKTRDFQQHPDSVPEVGEDAVTSVSPSSPPPPMTEEERQELQEELVKVRKDQGYRRTSETLSQAGLKATAAFSNVGSAISRKLEDVRNAPTFKSFEEKVETLKTKMTPSPSTTDPGNQEPSGQTSESLLSEPEGSPAQETPMH